MPSALSSDWNSPESRPETFEPARLTLCDAEIACCAGGLAAGMGDSVASSTAGPGLPGVNPKPGCEPGLPTDENASTRREDAS